MTRVSKYGASVVDRPQGTGSSILTGFTMATVERNGEGGARTGRRCACSLSLSSVCLREGNDERRKKAMAKVSRTAPPVPPYSTAAGGRIRRGGFESTAFNVVDTADAASWVPQSRACACVCSNNSGTTPEAPQVHC